MPVVNSAKYLSSGPLTQVVLANGLTEQHLFDARYFPSAVTVSGPTMLNWTYSVDGVGNITQISNGSTPRTYSYVDNLYFLKQGDGPWGTRSWTYDRIGNRLTETRGTTTDTYSYVNHNPRLTSVTMGGGAGTKDFLYDSNGNEIRMATPLSLLYQRYDGANRLFNMKDDASGAETYLTYDGRNFLTQARQNITTCCAPVLTQSVYSSEGVLQGRSVRSILGGTLTKDTKVLYFAGRPVGLLEMATAPATLSYLSVDHLGTPILETTSAGASLWSGGFEPFGKDWNGAQTAGEFLRFSGQWEDAAWAGVKDGFYYNLYRWYSSESGKYSTPDPLGLLFGGPNPFLYAVNRPTLLSDRSGLEPGLPPTSALVLGTCAWVAFQTGYEAGLSTGFRYGHCLAACGLRKCGLPIPVIALLGVANEVKQTGQCFWVGDNCHSAFAPIDFQDNRRGYSCPDRTSCEDRCRTFLNTPTKMPDQYGPLYGWPGVFGDW
jgi:RHS repeat-associated protein